MKTLDEAMEMMTFRPSKSPLTKQQMDARFKDFALRHKGLVDEVQQNATVQQTIHAFAEQLNQHINVLRAMPPGEERNTKAGGVMVQAIMHAFVHGVMIGVEMEKQE